MERHETDLVLVEFSTATSGVADLTWGQDQVCRWMENSAPYTEHMNLDVLIECEAGTRTTLDDVREALRVVIERHESLRTRLNVWEDGSYRQFVCASGRVPVRVHHCATHEATGVVLEELRRLPFTVFEWPLRVAVVTVSGVVSGVALCLSHVATDGWGVKVIAGDLRELLSAAPEERDALSAGPPRPLLQPREHAAAQRRAGGRSAVRAEAFWTAQLSRFPNDRFPLPLRTPESPRFPKITMRSPAAARALAEAAARHGTTVNAVLTGALAVLVSALSGLEDATFRLFCANRTSAESRNSVGTFFQIIPVALTVADLPFRDIAHAAWQASLRAYRVGERDPRRLDLLTESVASARGVDLDLECFLNIHGYGGQGDGKALTALETEATRLTAFDDDGGFDEWEPGKFYVDVWRVSGCFEVTLSADTALFSRDRLTGFLSCLEEVLLRAAARDAPRPKDLVRGAEALAGLRRREDLVLVDGCWVDPAEVQALLTQILSPRTAQVFIETGPTGRPSLTAYLVPRQPQKPQKPPSPPEVHRLLLAALPGHRFVMTPHRYVVCAAGPDAPATVEEWRRYEVLSEGPGRESPTPHAPDATRT
ncbi:condensation domain-containing protein [Streptomyces sp. NPDC060002]|uniref:condensation domain-containing protein n=1 Tax=Streptomyces sp. NPDC060002 TaxID=3347033 RepID=UPI00367A0CB2